MEQRRSRKKSMVVRIDTPKEGEEEDIGHTDTLPPPAPLTEAEAAREAFRNAINELPVKPENDGEKDAS